MKSLVLTGLLVCVGQMLALNPGVKLRIGKKGLEYVNRIVESKVNERLQSFTLNDLEDYSGNPQYSLKNIQITKVPVITSSVSFRPDRSGLTLAVNDYDIELSTDYWAKHTILLLPVTLSGRVTASFSDVSVSTTIVIDLDNDPQHSPLLKSTGCVAKVGDLKLKFEGRAAWLLNLIKGLFTEKVSKSIKDKICALVANTINKDGADVLKRTRLTHEIKKLFVDYSITGPVNSNSKYLEIKHKGEVSWMGDNSAIPIIAPLMPDKDPDNNFMAEVLVSKYSVSTLAYVAHKNGYLNLDVNPENLPVDKRPFLKATCPGSVCVGSIVPLVGENHPDSVISIKVYSPVSPQVTISTGGLSLQMTGILDLFADSEGSKPSILHCELSISLNGTASFENELISGNINSVSIRVSNVQTQLGKIETDDLNDVVKRGLNLNFIPNLNNIMAEGIPLPLVPEVTFTKSQMKYYDGFLAIGTDVKYQNIE
ncbi:unnamed protein product [Lymnaea stagnalis]|uniref:Uncharacterized protein n=1 Tax=Lymnaea stagnalis TaxID=6523 RepID=A0AAV2IE50_LYMST